MTKSLNVRLDDLLRELSALIFERPDDERVGINNQYVPEWAKKDLGAILGCLDCKSDMLPWIIVIDRSVSISVKQSKRSRTVDLTETSEEHP